MGISGLLPALKSIQVTKHISEFGGQTLAVDAYVWLHKGVLTCATELATAKDTHKYVDYAMRRVRLLRHHHIEPYIVFDGGPLPAKKGTEDDRKQRRDKSLAKGNALAAQGKHKEARDHYAKCVDVKPEMAFQLIKALRAENVRYVVAPYEADAQLAYLERIGLVDGILTEDSDLLVFGCRQVLFKFDFVANTVVSIMRKDFASVSGSGSDISLVGWSDVQFRAMAILSGCDYLPSVQGVGLKTACSLLRKWKTPEQVVRVITLEGKKSVPRNYLNQFKLADKCFQHQRVYCPKKEKLVYLTDVDSDWTDESEAYVGGDLDPSLAKKLAAGDIDPVTLLPMEDINPGFVPRAKALHSVSQAVHRRDKGRGKAKDAPAKEGILSFFGPNPTIPPRQSARSPISITPKRRGSAGKESGKRTLAEVMDYDITMKKHKQKSKFFDSPEPKAVVRATLVPTVGPSRSQNKENMYIGISTKDEEPEIDSDISMEAQGEVDSDMEIALDDPELVEQEDGYISPTPSCSGDMQDLSSPLRDECTPLRNSGTRDVEFGVDPISSPLSQATWRPRSHSPRPVTRTRSLDAPHSHPPARFPCVRSSLTHASGQVLPSASFPGPDLRHAFADDRSSDIDCSDEEKQASGSNSSATPTPSPPTPATPYETQIEDTDLCDPEALASKADVLRKEAVVAGWRQRWAMNSGSAKSNPPMRSKLTRRETNVTPVGRHTISHPDSRLHPYPRSAPHSSSKAIPDTASKPRRAQTRKSLPFFVPIRRECIPGVFKSSTSLDSPGSCANFDVEVKVEENVVLSTERLERFRSVLNYSDGVDEELIETR